MISSDEARERGLGAPLGIAMALGIMALVAVLAMIVTGAFMLLRAAT